MDFIDRLREKPAGTKKRIAFATSAVVTLLIFGVWVSVLHFGIGQKNADATAAVANSSDADVRPFSAFWSVISDGWGGLMNNINQIKTDTSSAKNLINALGSATSTNPTNDVFILSGTSTDNGQITP
jgi:hypothetical protein